MGFWCQLVVVVGLLLGASRAEAAAGEWRFGAAAGAGFATRSEPGLAARLSAAYELIENLELGLSAGLAWNGRHDAGTQRLLSFTPGVNYQFNVIQWIPYVGASGGYYFDMANGRPHGVMLAPEAGVDYLLSREVRVGIQYRPCFFLGSHAGLPMHQVLARIQLGTGW